MTMGTFKRRSKLLKINKGDTLLRKIYSEILEYDPAREKIKPEKIKV